MAEYIKREDVLDIIQDRIKDINKHEMSDVWRARKMMAIHLFREVQHLFAADVRENVRGEWIKYNELVSDVCVCSSCERYFIDSGDEYDYNFCPRCGAYLGGDQDADNSTHLDS